MSTTDDTVDESNNIDAAAAVRSAVENADAEDEKDKNQGDDSKDDASTEEDDSQDDSENNANGDDSEEDQDSDDDDSEEAKDKKKDGEPAERKFKNLAADDDATYINNLENAYSNSSAEAIRLNKELGSVTNQLQVTSRRVDAIIEAAQKDPDLAKKLNQVLDTNGNTPNSGGNDTTPVQDLGNDNEDPFLVSSKTEWEEKGRQEVQEILDSNPELLSDPTLNANVKHWMEVFSKEHYRVNRKVLGAGEAMTQAMKHLGVEDKRQKQNVANKAKELAAPSRPTKSRTPKPKAGAGLSESQGFFADKLGVSREKAEKFAS